MNLKKILWTLVRDLYLDIFLLLLLFIYNYSGKTFGLLEYLGLLLGFVSSLFWIISRVQLGRYFAVMPKASGLVTRGIYSKIRNPIYVFGTLTILGAVLPSRSLLQYALWATGAIVEIFRSAKEASVLQKRFGRKYSQYKSQTWF